MSGLGRGDAAGLNLNTCVPPVGVNYNPPVVPVPAVENVELWAKRGSLAAVRFDQMDNETSVIDSRTLRLLLVRAGYQHVSAHQKEDT